MDDVAHRVAFREAVESVLLPQLVPVEVVHDVLEEGLRGEALGAVHDGVVGSRGVAQQGLNDLCLAGAGLTENVDALRELLIWTADALEKLGDLLSPARVGLAQDGQAVREAEAVFGGVW